MATCPVGGFPVPAIPDKRDLEQFKYFLWEAAEALAVRDISQEAYYRLLVAQSFQESQWTLRGYRYEPNYDRLYVSTIRVPRGSSVSPYDRWSRSAAWIRQGPTVGAWFASHPKRAGEAVTGRDYSFLAQTRIAASYGPLQIMYPTAVEEGFPGLPEDLWKPENVAWPLKHLHTLVKWARAKAWSEIGCLKVALCRYNGGAYGNISPTVLDDHIYLEYIEKRYRACWGQPFFDDVDPVP